MKLEYITPKGDILSLTNNDRFQLSNVDGLTMASVDISSSTIGNVDGDFINAKRTIPRSIILDLTMEGNVNDNLRYVMRFIKPKQKAILRRTIDNEVMIISGIVEGIEAPRYSSKVVLQVSIYCSDPYWRYLSPTITEIGEVIDMFYFCALDTEEPFFIEEKKAFGEVDLTKTQTIYNNGDVETGMIIRIIATGNVSNPTIYKEDGTYIGLTNCVMSANDEIVISTIKGDKYIKYNGENYLTHLKEGSTWIQLDAGATKLTIDSDNRTESNVYFVLEYVERFV